MTFARTGFLRSAATRMVAALFPFADKMSGRRQSKQFLSYVAPALLVLLGPGLSWGIAPTRFNGVATTLPTGGAALSQPSAVTVNAAGNTYIADTGNSRIVMVNPQGSASVVAISGLSTALNLPTALTVDGSGTLYIADSGNNRIVTVSTSGSGTVVSTGGVTLSSPQGLALDQSSNLFIADTNTNRIVEVTAAGVASVFAITGLGTGLNAPSGLAVDVSGNLYIADSGNSRIVTVAAGGTAGLVLSITGLATALDTPRGVAVYGLGNIYIADTNNHRIVKVAPGGSGSVLSTGTVTLSAPKGVAVDVYGTVYIADTGNNQAVTVATSAVGFGHLQLGTASGVTQTLPFTVNVSTTLGGVKAFTTGTENLDFTVAGGTTCIAGTTNTTCTVDIQFLPTSPGLRRGAVVLYDNSDPQIPVVTVPLYGVGDAPIAALSPNTGTVINTGGLATSNPFQVAVDGAGNMYVGDYTGSNVTKIPVGGGSATVVSLGTPGGTATQNITGVALDGAGNLFVGDHQNSRILVVTPGGVVSVLSISGLSPALGFPTALAFDAAGNLYIADFTTGRVIRVSSVAVVGSTSTGSGTVIGTGAYSFAGGALTGLAVDPQGTVYTAARTQNSSSIIKVTAEGVASALAIPGNITPAISNPQGVGTDAMGNIYVVDTGHNRIIKITTAGVAFALSLSGLPAPTSLSSLLFGVTVDASGNIYIPDWTNNRLVFVNVSGAPLTFVSTKQGLTSTDSPKTATVTNLGNQPLVFAADPAFTADFSQPTGSTNQCLSGTSLASGTVCNVSVQFTPQSIGSLSAGITLTNNALNVAGSTQAVSVSGTGLTPGDTTSTTVVVSPTSLENGETATITATVSDTAAGHTSTVPTGAVSFTDTVGSTATSLNGGAPVNLSAGTAALTGVVLSGIGSHTITANYAGVSGSFLTSTGTTTVALSKAAVTVAGPATQPIHVPLGQAGSVPVTVACSCTTIAVPSGTLSYSVLDSSNASVDSGSLTLTGGATSSTATVPVAASILAGNYTVSVTYNGDSNYAASSAATTIPVAVDEFSLSAATGSSTSATVSPGGAASYRLAVSPSNGTTFPATVTFSVTGLPTGAIATFSPQTLAAGAGTTDVGLAVQVPTQTASLRPSHPLSLKWSTILLGALVLPLGRIRRATGKHGLTLCSILLAFAGTSVIGLTGCGSSPTPVRQPTAYTLTVTATSGPVSHSITLGLTVQ